MTKTCWTARSWATKITCWNYLAMASMKIQISQVSGKKNTTITQFLPKWRSFNPWKRSLKTPKKVTRKEPSPVSAVETLQCWVAFIESPPSMFEPSKNQLEMGLTIWEGFQLEDVKHGNIWWSIASGWFRKNIIQRHCIVVRVASSDIWRKFQTNTCIWLIDIDMHICLERWQFVDCWQDCDEYQNDPFAFVFVCGEFDAK